MPKYRIEYGVEWPAGHEACDEIIEAATLREAQDIADELRDTMVANTCPSWSDATPVEDAEEEAGDG